MQGTVDVWVGFLFRHKFDRDILKNSHRLQFVEVQLLGATDELLQLASAQQHEDFRALHDGLETLAKKRGEDECQTLLYGTTAQDTPEGVKLLADAFNEQPVEIALDKQLPILLGQLHADTSWHKFMHALLSKDCNVKKG